MVTIRLHQNEEDYSKAELVKGRVFLYDDMCKTLILKLWDDETQAFTGMGVFNSNNVVLDKIHVLSDIEDPNEQELMQEYSCNEESYNKLVMDRKSKFCQD